MDNPTASDKHRDDPSHQQWAVHRAQIEDLYIRDGLTIQQTQEKLKIRGFNVSVAQLKRWLLKWGLQKNVSMKDMERIVQTLQRDSPEELTKRSADKELTVNGHTVRLSQVKRYLRRRDVHVTEEQSQTANLLTVLREYRHVFDAENWDLTPRQRDKKFEQHWDKISAEVIYNKPSTSPTQRMRTSQDIIAKAPRVTTKEGHVIGVPGASLAGVQTSSTPFGRGVEDIEYTPASSTYTLPANTVIHSSSAILDRLSDLSQQTHDLQVTKSLGSLKRKRPRSEDGMVTNRRYEYQPGLLFACPYYKLDPIRFGEKNSENSRHRSCATALLRDIPRLKQHLYRVHTVPDHQCRRCQAVFDDQSSAEVHQTSQTQCESKPAENVIGMMSGDQRVAIRKRQIGTSEEENWYNIFEILFPHQPRPADPYSESGTTNTIEHFINFFRAMGKESSETLQLVRQLPPSTQDIVDSALQQAFWSTAGEDDEIHHYGSHLLGHESAASPDMVWYEPADFEGPNTITHLSPFDVQNQLAPIQSSHLYSASQRFPHLPQSLPSFYGPRALTRWRGAEFDENTEG